MFAITEPFHLVFSTHHHQNITHNNTDNNKTDNTVSATHKKVYFFSPLQQKWHYMQQFCILLCEQFTQFKRRLCPTIFYRWRRSAEKLSIIRVCNLGLPLPSISLDSHQSQIQQDEILN